MASGVVASKQSLYSLPQIEGAAEYNQRLAANIIDLSRATYGLDESFIKATCNSEEFLNDPIHCILNWMANIIWSPQKSKEECSILFIIKNIPDFTENTASQERLIQFGKMYFCKSKDPIESMHILEETLKIPDLQTRLENAKKRSQFEDVLDDLFPIMKSFQYALNLEHTPGWLLEVDERKGQDERALELEEARKRFLEARGKALLAHGLLPYKPHF